MCSGSAGGPRDTSARPADKNPLLEISSLVCTAMGKSSTGTPHSPQGVYLSTMPKGPNEPWGARAIPSPSPNPSSATRLSPSCTHYRWMRETVVLKAAWMSATEQVDTTNCLCAWSCSLTYCQCRELRLRHPGSMAVRANTSPCPP